MKKKTSITDKEKYGQFFSKNPKIREAIQSLIQNEGSLLEPSVGEGDLIFGLEHRSPVLIDYRPKVLSINGIDVIKMDFFNYTMENRFNTIVGNPPFVKYKLLDKEVMDKVSEYGYKKKANLYYFFIHKCIQQLEDNGELIFITPKEFMYSVSAITLRQYMSKMGTITHFIDCGEEKLFSDASVPSLCIFRFEKNNNNKITQFWETFNSFLNKESAIEKQILIINDQFSFSTGQTNTILSNLFDVKVGVVSGMDELYHTDRVADGKYVHSFRTNNGYKNYYYFDNIKSIDELPIDIRTLFLENKDKLINRKIKKYNENDWWKYGAVRNLEMMLSEKQRIYVAPKTRVSNPFFKGETQELYSGSLLALFPKNDKINIDKSIIFFNSDVFKQRLKEYFVMINDKYNFTPSVLGKIPLSLDEVS